MNVGLFSKPPKVQIAWGIVATVLLAILAEWLPDSGLLLLATTGVLSVASVILQRRLPLAVRVFATGSAWYLGYASCLTGRTMEPRLTGYTLQMAVMCFGLLAFLPMLSLLAIWSGRIRIVIVSAVLPISLAAACAVAAFEEHQFIRSHPNGIGPTSRWTVSNHWLSYDPKTGWLSGSD